MSRFPPSLNDEDKSDEKIHVIDKMNMIELLHSIKLTCWVEREEKITGLWMEETVTESENIVIGRQSQNAGTWIVRTRIHT